MRLLILNKKLFTSKCDINEIHCIYVIKNGGSLISKTALIMIKLIIFIFVPNLLCNHFLNISILRCMWQVPYTSDFFFFA